GMGGDEFNHVLDLAGHIVHGLINLFHLYVLRAATPYSIGNIKDELRAPILPRDIGGELSRRVAQVRGGEYDVGRREYIFQCGTGAGLDKGAKVRRKTAAL